MSVASDHVSRAGQKLELALSTLGADFKNKTVLDVGASTGGFTQVALRHGAKKVYAVEKGTRQLHASLKSDPRVVSLEKTDILKLDSLPELADVTVVDVSFVSLRSILPAITKFLESNAQWIILLKPQFEATAHYPEALNHGVIKNKTWRRRIIQEFEDWAKETFIIQGKVDSEVAGSKGNVERLYLLKTKG